MLMRTRMSTIVQDHNATHISHSLWAHLFVFITRYVNMLLRTTIEGTGGGPVLHSPSLYRRAPKKLNHFQLLTRPEGDRSCIHLRL